ncbi:MAG: STAS domain-containing protein [Angustibacter sp.]
MPRATDLSSALIPPPTDAGSVSLLVDADGQVLVVLHGCIDSRLQPEIRELVDDLVTNRADTTGHPVRVLAENVTGFELAGVWLLLELRRAARPASVTVVAPSPVVLEAMQRHDIQRVLVEEAASSTAAAPVAPCG